LIIAGVYGTEFLIKVKGADLKIFDFFIKLLRRTKLEIKKVENYQL